MGCGVCGDPGHNRRTHAQHAPVQDQALLDSLGPVVPQVPTGADIARAALQAARTEHLVGERGPELITREQAEQLWPDRVVVEADGSWSVEAVTLQGDLAGSFASSEGPNQDTPIVTDDVDAGQSVEEQDHVCEPAPDQVYFCRHCGKDLMVEDDAPEPWITPPWRTALGPDEPIVIREPGVYELTAEEYHSYEITGDWLSNSDAKKLLQTCPAQFDYDRRNGVRKISDAFDFGHVWHAVILGKGEAYQVFEPKKKDGRTADGKAQKLEVDAARAAGITPIYGDQFKLIEAMAAAVQADPVPHKLLTQPGRQEVCLFWHQRIKITDPHNKLFGQYVTVQRRAMIDHLPDMPENPDETVILVDGKTAEEVKPDDNMRKKIYDYRYHAQAETYCAAIEALFGRVAEVIFIMQSKKPPHLITPVEMDTPAMNVAAAENRQVMETWAECVETGIWPGYVTNGIATSGVPAWIERIYEDQIGEF